MTGISTEHLCLGYNNYQIDLYSLNSKYLDIRLILPSEIRALEYKINKYLSDNLARGKITLCIRKLMNKKLDYSKDYNLDFLKEIKKEICFIAESLDLNEDIKLELVLNRYDDKIAELKDEIDEEIEKALFTQLEKQVANLWLRREEEGSVLEKDIKSILEEIAETINHIREIEPDRLTRQRNKLKEQICSLMDSQEIPAERLEQEIIFYAEKLSIHEELIRLSSHINHFEETLKIENRKLKGKELTFISQEMLREINTVCSKANDLDIIRYSVQIKSLIDKIKEQIENII